MREKSAAKCLKKVLKDLKGFGVIVEVDNKTYEVIGVKYPESTFI